ncbi:MAG TPA: hypothetical protein VMK05_00330 [Burkholderiales bacterium]|nr:hypothetical protein [Burkholderiales bacterium]
MYRALACAIAAALALLLATSSTAEDIAPAARKAAAAIDALNVEQRWPAGVHVDWASGEPDGKPVGSSGKHTHCSAFVAAAAKQLGVYILRPPRHPQALLANAQYDWLESKGAKEGWQPVRDGAEAQALANRGLLVVAAYRNRNDHKPGHIAIVRPSDKSRAAIQSEGPQVTQAGGTNYRSTSLKQGFAAHPLAWTHNEVRYYAHAIDLAAVR